MAHRASMIVTWNSAKAQALVSASRCAKSGVWWAETGSVLEDASWMVLMWVKVGELLA